MGGHYGSIHVRNDDASAVHTALSELAREKKLKFLLSPYIDGWIGVFPAEHGSDFSVSENLAEKIPFIILHCTVYDDDVFSYHLYSGGKLIDSYNSCPDYFGESDEEKGGHAEVFKDFIPEKAIASLQALLAAERYDFEVMRLEKFAKLLKLSNAVTAYEYLQEGERDGIKHWKKFVHIPDLSDEKAKKKADAAKTRQILKLLREERVLLVDELAEKPANSSFRKSPSWSVTPSSEVVLLWTEVALLASNQSEWIRYRPSNWLPEMMGINSPNGVLISCFSPGGHWLLLTKGMTIQIQDTSTKSIVLERNLTADVFAAAFSHDDSKLFIASTDSLHSIDLLDQDKKTNAFDLDRCGCVTIAPHPDGQAIAMSYGGMLGLLEGPLLKQFGVGGLIDLRAYSPSLSDNAKIDKILSKAAEHASLEQVEKLREQIAWQQRHHYQPRESVAVLKFTPDGRWLLCGTNKGMRVFDWQKLTASATPTPEPALSLDTPAEAALVPESGYVYSVTYDALHQRVIAAGLSGKIYWLDLNSGASGELYGGPEQAPVTQIELTPDREALVMTRMLIHGDCDKRTRFQIWSYPRLCQRSGLSWQPKP
jgi:hypothetical protein